MAVNSAIFIDKSEMIQYLNSVVNTQQRYVSVSRPRRFGKTMAADMICAYFDRGADSRPMFEKMKLSACEPVAVAGQMLGWDAYLGKFDVIRIVMTRFIKKGTGISKGLADLQHAVIRDIRKTYPHIELLDEDSILQVMDDVYAETNRQFVIVIDEWDSVFREMRDDTESQTVYLNFLRDWLKDNPHISLAYITGILPIKKYGRHSALNMFDEYSMTAPMQLAEYTGFTEAEVKSLCDEYEMQFEDISDWYDGYLLSNAIPVRKRELYRKGEYPEHKVSVYSPLSVVNAMRNGIVDNYWNKTENYEALAEYIRMDYDGLKDTVTVLMEGGRIPADLTTYQNDMTTFHGKDDILALLIHLGYLGFEGNRKEGGIDSEHGMVFIPNKEILEEFKTSTKTAEWIPAFEKLKKSEELLKATLAMDGDQAARLVEEAHNQAANKTYHDEAALSYGIQLAYYAAQKYYTMLPEVDSGKGFADLVYIPGPKFSHLPVLLIELKYDKNADTAISQIRRQEYPQRLEHYKGNILLVAINYDKEISNESVNFKHHSCKIERA